MNLRLAIHKVYWRCERLITPGLKYSQFLYEQVLQEHVHPDRRWLDLGCGRQLLPPWRTEQEKRLLDNCKMVVGIDADLSSVKDHHGIAFKLVGDVGHLPFKDASFDLATANMVVEHLAQPEAEFREIHRILAPGGMFILHTPNTLGYTTLFSRMIPNSLKPSLVRVVEGRKQRDVFPTYYRANSRKRIAELAAASGFKVVKIRLVASTAEFIAWPLLPLLELFWIRLLLTDRFKELRTNLIAILQK